MDNEYCKICGKKLEMKLFQKMEVPYTNEIYYIADLICPEYNPIRFQDHACIKGKFFPTSIRFIPSEQ
jgi:hypothetical protein